MIAERIRNARRFRKFTPQQLARWLGVAEALVLAWERSDRNPKTEQLEQIAAILEVPVEWLASGTGGNPLDCVK